MLMESAPARQIVEQIVITVATGLGSERVDCRWATRPRRFTIGIGAAGIADARSVISA